MRGEETPAANFTLFNNRTLLLSSTGKRINDRRTTTINILPWIFNISRLYIPHSSTNRTKSDISCAKMNGARWL
jgi:hypothetical protein